MNILALNGGSATLKFKLYKFPDAGSETLLLEGEEEHSGGKGIVPSAQAVVKRCEKHGIDAIGYRIVHGGSTFVEPTLLSPERIETLRGLEFLDPLHNPAEVAMVEAGFRELPHAPGVAVFDTAFHSTLPELAWRYALPRGLTEHQHVRKYGFHGISFSFVSKELLKSQHRPPAGSRIIICHLGSGASICAIKDGASIDTSMGMTPLEGLVMSTRSGDIDPGLLLYLLHSGKLSIDELDDTLNHKSGLLGLSGSSGDVRTLEEAEAKGDSAANMALEIFSYRVCTYIGGYAAALGGADTIAFAGGIGERSPEIREKICWRLKFLGVELSATANAAALGKKPAKITTESSSVQVWVIPTNEELEVSRQSYGVVRSLGQ